MKAKKLIEVAMPIKEISAESSRDNRLSKGHIKSFHQWWARRPLPTCRSVVFASLVPDPLDSNCPNAFKDGVSYLLSDNIYKPYTDIPYTAIIDPMEDNPRNRLLMFIGKFSEVCQNNLKKNQNTTAKDILSNGSLIKWENKNNPKILRIARELIYIAYNSELNPELGLETIHHKFELEYNKVLESRDKYFSLIDRHINSEITKSYLQQLEKDIELFQSHMPSVFDPFAGGGAIPMEAARLGCRSYGNDINPVAHIIEICSAEFPQKYGNPIIYSHNAFIEKYGERGIKLYEKLYNDKPVDVFKIRNRIAFDIEYYAKLILDKAFQKSGYLYPQLVKNEKLVALYWARTAKCSNPSCGAEVPLIDSFYLAKTSSKSVYLDPIITGKHIDFEIKEGKDAKKGWLTSKQCSLVCPCCGSITDVETLKEQSITGGLKSRLIAVIGDNGRGKTYRIPTKAYERTILATDYLTGQEFVPQEKLAVEYTQALPCCTWGIISWKQMFSYRQIKMLNSILEGFEDIKTILNKDDDYNKAIITLLAVWFDRIVLYNTSFGTYEPGGEKVSRPMVRQAIPMTFDYPESNPFCGIAGSAINQLELITSYLYEEEEIPFSVIFNNASSGEKSQFSPKSITAVITDPPYYNAISYADLSDFYYVWLKKTLSDIHPLTVATPYTPKEEECTAIKHRFQGNEIEANKHFETKLTQILDAIEIQTKEIVSIMFAHQSTEAWTTLCNSILSARMNITGSWPLDTEYNAGYKSDKAFLESSVTVSCRPAERKGFAEYKEVERLIKSKITTEVNYLYDLGFRGADLLTACFGKAVSEFGKYKEVEKSNGDLVTVSQLLELAKISAFNTLLQGINADEETRFYIGWLQLNGMGDIDHDDATKFTRVGVNVNVHDIISQHLLINNGKKDHLASALEHLNGSSINLGCNINDKLIEQVHRAMLLYKEENRGKLLKQLRDTNSVNANSQLWRLLATLKELLPACDDLKQVQGLIANGDNLRDAAKNNKQIDTIQMTLDF